MLNRVGIEPVVLSEELCCGHDLLWSGDREGFARLARHNARPSPANGVRRILTTCAECCRTWRLDYPDAAPEYRPRVQHLAEVLAERLEKGELEPRHVASARITYHDPCRLGRQLGIFDAPRQVLTAIPEAELREMEHSGADAVCCGSPGFIHCDAASRKLQTQRLESAAATGATKMLTACPKCLIHFACAQHEDRRQGRRRQPIELEDLTVFAAKTLERPVTAAPPHSGSPKGEAP